MAQSFTNTLPTTQSIYDSINKKNPSSSIYGALTGGTPAASALQSKITPPPKPTLPPIASASTPLASTKITHPDGTIVEQKHVTTPTTTSTAPATGTPGLLDSLKKQAADVQGKIDNKQYDTPAPVTTPTATPTNTDITTPPETDLTYQGLLKRALQKQQEAADTNQVINQSEQNVMHNPGYTLDTGRGLAGLIQQNYGQQGANANAVAQGAESLAGKVAPVAGATFFGSPLSGGVVGEGNGLISGNVSKALELVKAGADPKDASVQSLLSGLGPIAQNQFTTGVQAIKGGTYNPTATSAIVQQNNAQGQDYQKKSLDLGTTLDQLNNVTKPIVSLIQGAGLNQENNPFFNKSLNEYSAQLKNPAAQAGLSAGIAEVKNYVSQILGSGGDLTPTAVTDLTNSFDPGNFTAQQFTDFMKMVDNYGQIRKAGFDTSSTGSYGGQSGFTGTPANPSSTSVIPADNPSAGIPGSSNPVAQGVVGGAMQLLGGIEGIITGVAGAASKILK